MTKYHSGSVAAVLRSLMLVLEDSRDVYINGQRFQFTLRFLPTTANRNRDEKPYADPHLLISHCLITVERS